MPPSPAAAAARRGLLLGEHLDLPVDQRTPVDRQSSARVDAVVRGWLAGPGVLPGSLADRPELTVPLAGRVDPGGRCGEDARGWLAAALRTGRPRPVEPPADWAPWQTALLDLLSPALDTARHEALAALGPPGRREEPAARGCAAWLRCPPTALLRLVTGAFVLDMDAARSLSSDPDGVGNWFEAHLAALGAEGQREGFAERYPLFGRLAGATIRGWRDAGVEFGRRLAADADEIAALLGADGLDLIGVRPGLGDPHGGGRTVAAVTFAQGRVAYKPRPVGAAAGLRALLDRLPVEVGVPAVIDRGGYGWMQWVEKAPVTDRAAARRYYRRLGRLNVVAWLLGANDLHSENIVAAGDTPYLVDVETLLTPVPRHEDDGHNHAAPGLLLESPVSTGILPFTLDLGDGHHADLSAYGDSAGQLGAAVTTWDGAGTSAMRAVSRRLPQADPASVPRFADGTALDAFDFAADVVAGSAEMLAALAPVAAGLPAEVAGWPLRRTRALLRNTATYAQVTDYLRHPAVLHEPFLGDGAFEPLGQPVHADPAGQRAVVAAERAALLRGDVPLFEVAVDGTDLIHDDGTVGPGFFAASPLDRVRSRAARLATERPVLDWVTAAALRVARVNRDRSRDARCCDRLPDRPVTDGTLVAAAHAIGRRLAELACRDGGDLSWLTLRVDAAERWRVVVADDSLYLGTTGVLAFLEALGSADPAVEQVRDQLRAQWRRREPAGLGAYTGAAGDLWVALQLGEAERAARLVDRLAAPAEGLDVLSGAAGVLLVLSRAARTPLRDRALAAAAPHVRRLLDSAVERDAGATWDTAGTGPLVGFAHGSAGIGYALGEYAAVSPDGTLADACRAAVRAATRWETARYDADAANWPDLRPDSDGFSPSWCNGAAGIGLARAGALLRGDPPTRGHAPAQSDAPARGHAPVRGDAPVKGHAPAGGDGADRDGDGAAGLRADVQRAVAATLPAGIGRGQGLCHGDLGAVELLVAGAVACARPDWAADARRVAGMVAADVLERGGATTIEFGPGLDLPGLIVGAAGIGYQLLRVAAPDRVPSVLTLAGRP